MLLKSNELHTHTKTILSFVKSKSLRNFARINIAHIGFNHSCPFYQNWLNILQTLKTNNTHISTRRKLAPFSKYDLCQYFYSRYVR